METINDLIVDLGNPNNEVIMDAYDKKFAEMQKYIPFLEAMIERLQKVKDKSREAQLQKMQSLHGILSNSKRKLRIETLQRCEDVLQKLHNKVEKGNTAGINPLHKKSGENSTQNASSKDTAKTKLAEPSQEKMLENETPASPSPTGSPEHMPKSTPIIIPTERSDEASTCKCDSKPASPDQCENIPVTIPIIIPTERKAECKNNQNSTNHNSNNCGSDSNDPFSEWDMLEESENQINKSRRNTWQSVIAPGTDVATAAKLVCDNLPQKVIPEGRPHVPMAPRHIPAIPAPSLGGLRRIMPTFDKSRHGSTSAGTMHSDRRSQSPVNVPEVRLKSPDPDILFPRLKITSPRQKDCINQPKLSPKPSTPLLVSPPSVLTEPPLSIEDLAELLCEESDCGKKDQHNKDIAANDAKSKTSKNSGIDDVGKSKMETLAGRNQRRNLKEGSEVSKVPNSFVLTQEDIDRESERRWEEIDKHIVKLTARRCLPHKHSISSSSSRPETSKAGDTKVTPSPPRISQPLLSPSLLSADKPVDHRNLPPSPMQNTMIEKENEKEHRYADNYERHPRQFRDLQERECGDDAKDMNVVSGNLSRPTEEQVGNMTYPNLRNNMDPGSKTDESIRNAPLYQRRSQSNVLSADAACTLGRNDEYRRENVDYFNRNTGTMTKRNPLLPSPMAPEFTNSPQWGSGPNYSGNIRPPPTQAPSNTYQRNQNNTNFHQDMWQMGSNCPPGMTPDFHQMNDPESRIPQFNPHPPPIRPMINPASRPQETNRGLHAEGGFREETPGPTSVIPPLLSPSAYPTGPQYRNTRMENRSYDASYDRPSDISQPRHTWDSSTTRVSDVGYRRDGDSARGRSGNDGPACRPGTSAPYTRPSTPSSLWSRDRERNDNDWNRRGRGRERYYNDRGGRGDSRCGFIRDSRRTEWERDGHNERDNRVRLNKDNRVSERDPRMRTEQKPPSPVIPKETVAATTVRDPRLIKDAFNVVDSVKDVVGSSGDRDPRRRISETKGSRKSSPNGIQPRGKEKNKNQKLMEAKNRRESEAEDKESDKMLKDKLHSPLECLYGVIDTKAKTGQGYGLQKFKIPKIKRPDPPPPPPKIETAIIEVKVSEISSSVMHEQLPVTSQQNAKDEKNEGDQITRKAKEESGRTDDAASALAVHISKPEQLDDNKVHDAINNKVVSPIGDDVHDAVVTSTQVHPIIDSVQQLDSIDPPKQSDTSKPKEEVTKEWIEALIRKSFEFGQGKQLFDQAKLLHKLGEALHSKKMKKIKKIIESDSESSSSSTEKVMESRKLQVRKKRRVIFSDSSDEESLADRLGLLKDTLNEQNTNDPTKIADIEQESKLNASSQNDNDTASESKLDIVEKSKNSDEDEKVSNATTAVEQLAISTPKKKRGYKKRGKGSKKKESATENPVDSKLAESNLPKDNPQPLDENEKVKEKVPAKIKNKRRNSLEMLQEDIREMFISEGVVTATGHRMCRLIKEGNGNLNSTVPTLPNSSSDAADKKTRKSGSKHTINSETDETDFADQLKANDFDQNNRNKYKASKASQPEATKGSHLGLQKRTSKRVSKVISRQYIESSDSEDDEPLINSLTPSESLKSLYSSQSEATTVTEPSESPQKSEASQSLDAEKFEESREVMLRRSKRIPRVIVEKTEPSRIDSSKIMFESSSDESFGIDVSDLAAAVDISLHPEPESRPEPEVVVSLRVSRRKTRMQTTETHNQRSKNDKSAKTTEDKVDDAMSLTDEGSVLSDISMSGSSTLSRRNTKSSNTKNTTKGQQDTNEELLSNILIGLTAKPATEKVTEEIEKESDADADEELDESICDTEGIKKGVTKRKKKKFNWQLGILSKKKRKKKKTSASISPEIPALEADLNDKTVNIVESLDASQEPGNSNLSRNNDTLDNDDVTFQQSVPGTDSVNSNSEVRGCKNMNIPDKKQSTDDGEPADIEHITGNEVYSIDQVNTFEDLSSSEAEKLLEHAWTGQERYKCMLCTFTGKNIVHHYKLNHPEDEVLISRLPQSDAKVAIEESSNSDMRRAGLKSCCNEKFEYNCRFCLFCTTDTKELAKEAFYEHCTGHTGEYRFKCVSCPYQTVAKSSLKSHYYKVCRKFADNVSVAIIEDSIPEEDAVNGYICSLCNFVQLKKCNIEKHLLTKHRYNSTAKIVEINMSKRVNAGSSTKIDSTIMFKDNMVGNDNVSTPEKTSVTVTEVLDQTDEIIEIIENATDIQRVPMTGTDSPQKKISIANVNTEIKITEESTCLQVPTDAENSEKEVDNAAGKKALVVEKIGINESMETAFVLPQQENETSTVGGNLSVFVCPPEVAIKEHEIQLQRKKKMQEIVENIGIKVNKDGINKSLSIIDKLKVKMDTNSQVDKEPNAIERNSRDPLMSLPDKSQPCSDINLFQSDVEENLCDKKPSKLNIDENSFNQITLVPDSNLNISMNCEEGLSLQDNLNGSNNSESKPKDPLVSFDDTLPDFGSDTETSDVEMTSTFVPFESDSSNEQSENQISQDVNSLLKETATDNNASARGLMAITIQRLAAQLQSAKTGMSSQATDDEQMNVDQVNDEKIIPEAPDVVPLSHIKELWNNQFTKPKEAKLEPSDDSSPPKTLIRIRRLSGDKLSVPSNPVEAHEENQLSSTGSASDLGVDVLQTDTEEECSFLRIENVVSLAPTGDDAEDESSIISDIRKAVETSPVKPRISILKKSPIILQKVGNRSVLNQRLMNTMNNTGEPLKIIPLKSLPSTSQTSNKQVVTNIVPVQSTSKLQNNTHLKKSVFMPKIVKTTGTATIATQVKPAGSVQVPVKPNYKIIKLTRTATLLKHKECVAQSIAIKLKSPEAYQLMLTPAKLCHMFKCMARDCTYTTSSLEYFKKHCNEHESVCVKEKAIRPFGYQNCAYCCTVLDDWDAMEAHLINRHAHCRYQCRFCFYRAVTQSYVELHQAVSHPSQVITVLQGKAIHDKIPDERMDRSECVKPFICQQECWKSFYIPEKFISHLKTKHGPLLSIYKCHLCAQTSLKPEQLVSHYKIHGIYKYQCMYCVNGSDMLWELHNHLSNVHCNLPPHVIERNLMSQATKEQNVIDQLIVKNVEDDFKYTDLVTNIEEIPEECWQLAKPQSQNDDQSTSKNSSSTSPTEIFLSSSDRGVNISLLKRNLFSQISESGETQSNATGTPAMSRYTIQDTNEDESLDNRISIPEVDDPNEYCIPLNIELLPDKSHIDKSISNSSLGQSQEHRLKTCLSFEYSANNDSDGCPDVGNSQKLVEESDLRKTLLTIENATDPLSLNTHSNSLEQLVRDKGVKRSDSFNNFAHDGYSDSSPIAIDSTEKKAEPSDDSDIEILEDNTQTVTKSSKPEVKTTENAKTHSQISTSTATTSDKTEETQSVMESNSNDTNLNITPNTNLETTSNAVRQLLTLDDIKDTGFTGSDLYKCGNYNCSFNSDTPELLKCHLSTCTADNDIKSLICAHCKKRFVKVGFLLEHLKTHSLKRFGCSLCSMRCTMPYQAMSHMKSKHKFASNKLVPADPKNPSTDGLFVVQPIRGATEKGRGKKRTPTKVSDKENEKSIDVEKLSFNPDEIESLPRQAIYNREVMCAVCPYRTKVRTNMIRHLQLHAKDESVPESGPVNPVPCLDKKERMFDKMVNLASSSHQNGRMGSKSRDVSKENTDDASLPQFVPEHKRYVCGVAECNYLTVDDTMLRCHLKALHSDEPYFRCPHCSSPQPGQETQNIGIDKMGIHLKMHDTRLYKCSHCNHHHYHRHVVERHLSDKHGDKRPFVKVIREPESVETTQNVQDEVEDEGPDRDGNHWKCNLCDYKCIYKNEMISHASTEHEERSQFKCGECSYKTTGKINIEQHFVSRHPEEPQIKYDMIYQKLKGGLKKIGEMTDQGTTDEPFDTTPLWRRDMPRIRHIRGILLEDEEAAAATDSPVKSAKRKSEGSDIIGKQAKLKPSKSTASEIGKSSDEKVKIITAKTTEIKKGTEPNSPINERVSKIRAVDKLRLLDKTEDDKLPESLENPVTDTSISEDFSELSDSEMGQFGPYGKPNGTLYVCTLCNYFETRYKHDLRDHLYRELKYKKWHCRACGFLSVNRHTLVKHFTKQHPGEEPDHEMLTPDNSIEEWVTTLLQRQTSIIKGITKKSSSKTKVDKLTPSGPSQVSRQFKKSAKEINPSVQTVIKATDDTSKTFDLTHAISKLQDSSIDANMEADVDDEDSRDNNDLVIDLKDDNLEEAEVQKEKTTSTKSRDSKDGEKTLLCKHCNMRFARLRGFKLHVQVAHLKRLDFLCPYCDRSTNSEVLMRQHITAKHPDLPVKIIHNPAAGGPELTKEFWEKEYGLVCSGKTKKRKRQSSAADLNKLKDDTDRTACRDVCDLCGFSALNLTGFKAHMRMHANKSTIKCGHCAFSGSADTDVWQHWKVSHPHAPFKVEELSTAGPSNRSPVLSDEKKSRIEEYSDDVEEEQVPLAGDTSEKLIFCCFYCSLHSSSLDTVRSHWKMIHKERKDENDPSKWKTGLPFKYKTMCMPLQSSPQNLLQCSYCDKKGVKATLRVHIRRKHSHLPPRFIKLDDMAEQGWTCQWCNEFCETEEKMNHHQDMFHSHLPLHFKKQEYEEQHRGYSCPECSFTSVSIGGMQKHVVKHVNFLTCKYCNAAFASQNLVAAHNAEFHPGLELKIDSISNYDSLVTSMMSKVKWSKPKQWVMSTTMTGETKVGTEPKKHAVAKKSTAKPPSRVQFSPNKMRCVARKSTKTLTRHSSSFLVNSSRDHLGASSPNSDRNPMRSPAGFSYYRVTSPPISLASLSTYMSVGGHQMKVNCATLGQLMNINPRVMVKDLRQDLKSSALFSHRT
ncbi:uncharacterized protein LOC107227843 isoform X2 [Neodiprion lecontei]|uniref:Uncharacterized protein LOC107227843 isoform X2 n=1 Tax=Neodiprion lecontei TaxID=441921 RepID=A0ABM3FLZ9_NEOLC|nr:uncharacterized protein LOC107227843 isoform X2 [Neodiprion lecontei]